MKKIGRFQLIVLAVAIFFAAFAVLVFSGAIGLKKTDTTPVGGTVYIWGTLPQDGMENILAVYERAHQEVTIKYEEHTRANFERDVVEALARGDGPDMVVLPHDVFVKMADKISPIPFVNLPERSYKDSFITGSEIFVSGAGTYALPLAVDPLVMYWNRTLFGSEALVSPPRFWTQVSDLPAKLTKRDKRGDIMQSAVALGTTGNIDHYSALLSAMIMQTGDPITTIDETGKLRSVIGTTDGAVSAIRFFENFSDTDLAQYSWNTSLPRARGAFIGERLAVYFGPGSEISSIKQGNPHLDFDMEILPQLSASSLRSTYGDFYGLAILRASPVKDLAQGVAEGVTFGDAAKKVYSELGLASVRRDILSAGSSDARAAIVLESAIISKAWLPPDPLSADTIFADLIRDTTVGRTSIEQGLSHMRSALSRAFGNN